MPLISVIIPAYNAEKTIERTIESVLNQTFSDFELIIVDDGSQDSTLKMISSISDPRIKVFSSPHSGANPARNCGFSHSAGEFIAFLDADDLWTSDKLEAQLKALQTNPKAAVAYSWTDLIDESDQFLRPGNHTTENGNVYAKLLLTCFVVSGSNPLIRRQAFIKVGGFDESLTASQDFDLYLRLAAHYDYVAVPSPQVLYRISHNSMSTNIRRHEATSLFVRERAFKQAPEPLPQPLKRHSIANFYKFDIVRLLNDPPSRERGLESARLLGKTIRYDPSLLKKKVIFKLFFKIVVFSVLPPQQAKSLLAHFKSLSNINALLVHVKTEPSELKYFL
jgi:glycosyltransferase involved in cell wall biosynthesis